MDTLLEVKNLSKSYGQFKALNGLNMQVSRGDIFGFLGKNGAGKSTTIRCILTLIKPDSGEILYSSKPIQTNRNAFLKNIGCIVEKPDFYIHMSALKNLEISAKMYGVKSSKSQLLEMLDLVGLNGKENINVKSFSQGMKQRLGIAQTLIHNPELIILDEPTNCLDPNGIIDFRNIIQRLKSEFNKTIIISSHILAEMELMVDSFIIIDKGKEMIQGKTADLLSEKEMTVSIECAEVDSLYSYLLNSDYDKKLIGKDQQTITIKLDKEEIPLLNQYIVNGGHSIYSFNSRKKLEDLFLSITNTH